MENYKTIAQIESETNNNIYYSAFDYARSVALTNFLRELEQEHSDAFRLITAHPFITHDRSDETKQEKQFTLGMWATWGIGETIYYCQMNENPFFDAYITRSYNIDHKTRRSEYGSNMNEIFYKCANWDATPETIEQLTKNIRAAYDHTNARAGHWYTRDIPAYERQEQQKIYTH